MIKILIVLLDLLINCLYKIIYELFKCFFGKNARMIIIIFTLIIFYVAWTTEEFVVAGIITIIGIIFLTKGGKKNDF